MSAEPGPGQGPAREPRSRSAALGWRLFFALLCLVLVVQFLLRHALEGDSADGRSSGGRGGMSAPGRAPFPRQGEFSSVPRAVEVKPRPPSAADPWQDRSKRE